MKTKMMCLSFFLCMSLFLISCDQSKVCECDISVTVMGVSQTQTVSGEIEDGDCEDIEEVRDALAALEALGGSYDIDCREK